jgi:PIN domain nuclease of toxin-antitoxin system
VKAYLLDTNAFLWMSFQSSMIGAEAREALTEGVRFVSVVTIAEIAIKSALGKLTLPAPFHTDFEAAVQGLLEDEVVDLLPLELAVVAKLRHLPLYHRDPFDRMIIAQALESGLAVATRDRAFSAYAGLDILEI